MPLGAAAGAKIGDTMHQKDERIADLRGTVDSSNTTIAHLEGDIDTLSDELGAQAVTVQADLAAESGVTALFARLQDMGFVANAIVNNAADQSVAEDRLP